MNNKSKYQRQDLLLGRYRKKQLLQQFPQNVQLWEIQNVYTKQKAWAKIKKGNKIEEDPLMEESNTIFQMRGHLGFPYLLWSGRQKQNLFLITQQLGMSLQQLLESCPQRRFSLKTVCMIGIQLIKIIEDFHNKQFIHGHICPQYVHIGKKEKNHTIVVRNFQYSIVYQRKYANQQQIKQSNLKITIFTAFNQLIAGKTSKRDDIQTIIVILIYFLKGALPWQNVISKSQSEHTKKIKLIQSMRQNDHELFKQIPGQFKQMLIQARAMEFQSQPTYIWYISKLQLLMHRNNWSQDYLYDWVKNSKYLQKFRLNKSLPTFCLQNEEQLLKKVYSPYQKRIEIQQIFKRSENNNKNTIHSAKTIDSQKKLPELSQEQNQCIIM